MALGELLEGIPDERPSEEVWELGQERIGEEEARGKETAGKEKEGPQENAQ